jgi:hypothetical protein
VAHSLQAVGKVKTVLDASSEPLSFLVLPAPLGFLFQVGVALMVRFKDTIQT